ncbi:MAG: tRNA uridine-5-carboxymethylaminomethyl(34) synthesis GTPase MnmE, partial [Spirochaetales bacterium]
MQAGLGSKRQKTSTDDALEAVTHAIEATQQGFALDAIAQDIENALQSLGEITGEVKADDILESIFSRFCVGK